MESILQPLMTSQSVAHAVMVLCLVAAAGLALGTIRVFHIKLGIAGVLFAGLLAGHIGFALNEHVIDFARDFGLILYVYTLGLQMGPGFFSSFRRQGFSLNLAAAGVVALGALTTLGLGFFSGLEQHAVIGLYSGATTNTPSLAAAQQTLKDLGSSAESIGQTGAGYAIAYPFGIIGTMLSMVLIQRLFRIDPSKEAEAFSNLQERPAAPLTTLNLEVKNPNLHGLPISQIPALSGRSVVISRVMHDNRMQIARPDMIINLGDILHAVGTKDQLEQLRLVVGSVSPVDLKAVRTSLISRRVIVTRSEVIGKTIEELDLVGRHGVTLTRVSRSGVEFTTPSNFRVEFADTLVVVGEKADVENIAHEVGDMPRILRHTHFIPFFLGLAFGVFIGSIPIFLPGLVSPVKLGLAGGPLIAAILFSRIGHVGPLVWYMPMSANFMMREFGIVIFLSCVGLKSGAQFISMLTEGSGLLWLLCGAVVTIAPLLAVSLVMRKIYRLNFVSLTGLMAGSITDPPSLAFAGSLTKSDAPSIAYATVFPLVMLLRVLSAQMLTLALCG